MKRRKKTEEKNEEYFLTYKIKHTFVGLANSFVLILSTRMLLKHKCYKNIKLTQCNIIIYQVKNWFGLRQI